MAAEGGGGLGGCGGAKLAPGGEASEGAVGVGGGSAAASLARGPRSESGRGRDPAEGAVFITRLGKRVSSHCHPSRGARQPMGTGREAGRVGGGLGQGPPRAFLLPASLLLGAGHGPITSWLGWDLGNFSGDGLSSASLWVLKKAGSRGGWGARPGLNRRGPGQRAKEAWEEARGWEGRETAGLWSAGNGWVGRPAGEGAGRGGSQGSSRSEGAEKETKSA